MTDTWFDPAPHKSGFVTVNGVRLNYLDWGGSGPALILIHGASGNPHWFDDLASAFTDRFRVVAYARRGHGLSEAKGPYDTATLTEDLVGLMDALGITRAHLAGHSMGGNEITGIACTHPERVDRIVYLEGGYDWADPACVEAFNSYPADQTTPASALTSLDAYRAYNRTTWASGVKEPSLIEAYIRDSVVIQPDGTVRERMSMSVFQEVFAAVLSNRRDYTHVRSPALAIYAETFLDTRHGDLADRKKNLDWELRCVTQFRAASIERIRRELPGVEVLTVPGNHNDSIFTSRDKVVSTMRRFLIGSTPQG